MKSRMLTTEDRYKSLRRAAKGFVRCIYRMTKCRHRHFVQHCNRCKKYPECTLYLGYYNYWVDLQQEVED